jgi:hypothetical protein
MRIWLLTVFGLALASTLLTRLGDMVWSPGLWPRFGVGMTINKTISALIATGPVAVLLGLWAARLAPFGKERRALVLGALGCGIGFVALQLAELRWSGVRWGGKVPPMPALALYLPYVAALGGFVFVELSRNRNRRRARRSAASAAHSEGENRSRRSAG